MIPKLYHSIRIYIYNIAKIILSFKNDSKSQLCRQIGYDADAKFIVVKPFKFCNTKHINDRKFLFKTKQISRSFKKHTEARTKWPTFCWRLFATHFLQNMDISSSKFHWHMIPVNWQVNTGLVNGFTVDGSNTPSQRTRDAIITWLWRRNDVTTSLWRNNDVIITPCVHWDYLSQCCLTQMYNAVT